MYDVKGSKVPLGGFYLKELNLFKSLGSCSLISQLSYSIFLTSVDCNAETSCFKLLGIKISTAILKS